MKNRVENRKKFVVKTAERERALQSIMSPLFVSFPIKMAAFRLLLLHSFSSLNSL